MCGILGIINRDTNVEPSMLMESIAILKHRGPDGNGTYVKGNIGLGHTRLSIIDLSEHGAQPMSKFERYHITFNGEIYNYLELRKDLEVDGCKFTTDTDTEVLLAMYQKYGNDCLKYLDGMFSFVIYDELENKLFGARDRFGEKPLHYNFTSNSFSFCSEIKGLMPFGVKKSWREQAIVNYLHNGTVYDEVNPENTFFEGIFKVKPAHYFEFDILNWNIKFTKYWSLDDIQINNSISFHDAKVRLKELFNEGLKRRLRSDVQLGTSLSGGIDSSVVALSIVNHDSFEGRLNTYSARFKGFANDEGKFMDLAVNHTDKIDRYDTWLNEDSLMENIASLNYAQDEPYGSASMLAQYMVFKLAKESGTTVLLDGQGSDEYFAGYFGYYKRYMRLLEVYDKPRFKEELPYYNSLHNHDEYVSYKSEENLRMKLGRYKSTLFGNHPISKKHLKERLLIDTQGGHLQALLRYGDRSSMAHSVESRLPFLYHKLVEFVFSLPDNYLLNKGWTKYILRESFSDVLPREIAYRKDKLGFETPNDKWLKSIDSLIREKESYLKNNFELKSDEISTWRSFLMSTYLGEIEV